MVAKIRGLTRIRDKEKVVSTLISAFTDYPQLIKAFPKRNRRIIAIEANLRFYAVYSMRFGRAYSLDNECNGIVILLSSFQRKASKFKYKIAGSYSSKYKDTISSLTEQEKKTRLELFSEMELMEKDINFPAKYMYISFLGVRREYQRQGIGHKIMEKVIEYGKQKTIPIVLCTSEPKDVDFYQSLGFKIMGITSSKKYEFINIYLVKS